MRAAIGLIAALTMTVAAPSFAQESGGESHIETDRDSFTPATTVAGPRRLILESAYSFIDNRTTPDGHSLPEFVGRYGLGDWFELRFGANHETGGESAAVSGTEFGADEDDEGGASGSESNVSYGMKTLLTEHQGFVPRSSFILQATTPTSGPETSTGLVATYVWGWELTERLQWDAAMRYGYGSAEGDHHNRWAPSTVLKYELGERWTTHVEYFGIFSQGKTVESSQSYISPGAHFLLTPNCELGVRVGWGLTDDAAAFFTNVGTGLRF